MNNPFIPLQETEKYERNVIMESTPLVQTNFKSNRDIAIDLFSPIVSKPEQITFESVLNTKSEPSFGIDDMSTWLGGRCKFLKLFLTKSVVIKKTNYKCLLIF